MLAGLFLASEGSKDATSVEKTCTGSSWPGDDVPPRTRLQSKRRSATSPVAVLRSNWLMASGKRSEMELASCRASSSTWTLSAMFARHSRVARS